MAEYKDWLEFFARRGTDLTDLYLLCALKVWASQQQPERVARQPIPLDERGLLRIPEDWNRVDLGYLEIRVWARDAKHLPRIVERVPTADAHLGQLPFEALMVQQLYRRLPTPFAGKVRFEITWQGKRRTWREYGARVGWRWPVEA